MNALLNIDAIEIAFIDRKLAQQISERFDIAWLSLSKAKPIVGYDEAAEKNITHSIHSTISVQEHKENLTSMLITKLKQHKIILSRLWMQKHEIKFNMNNDTIEFIAEHCDHVDATSIKWTIVTKESKAFMSNKIMRILSKSEPLKKKATERKKVNMEEFFKTVQSTTPSDVEFQCVKEENSQKRFKLLNPRSNKY